MPEYIAKSVAIARLTALEIGNPCATIEDARRTIADTRPADVDTVTRCKDCEKSGVTEFGKRYCKEPMGCFCGCIPVEDDYFCSGGKELGVWYRTEEARKAAYTKLARQVEIGKRQDREDILYRLRLIEACINKTDKRTLRIWKQLQQLLHLESEETE